MYLSEEILSQSYHRNEVYKKCLKEPHPWEKSQENQADTLNVDAVAKVVITLEEKFVAPVGLVTLLRKDLILGRKNNLYIIYFSF